MSKEKTLVAGQVRVKGGKYYTVINHTINGERKAKWEKTGLAVTCGNKKKALSILRDRVRNFVAMGSVDSHTTVSQV